MRCLPSFSLSQLPLGWSGALPASCQTLHTCSRSDKTHTKKKGRLIFSRGAALHSTRFRCSEKQRACMCEISAADSCHIARCVHTWRRFSAVSAHGTVECVQTWLVSLNGEPRASGRPPFGLTCVVSVIPRKRRGRRSACFWEKSRRRGKTFCLNVALILPNKCKRSRANRPLWQLNLPGGTWLSISFLCFFFLLLSPNWFSSAACGSDLKNLCSRTVFTKDFFCGACAWWE